jgi:hypothetical protein
MQLQPIDARGKTVEQVAQEVHAVAQRAAVEPLSGQVTIPARPPGGAGAAAMPGGGNAVRLVLAWIGPVLAEVLASQGPQALERLIGLLTGGGGQAPAAPGRPTA